MNGAQPITPEQVHDEVLSLRAEIHKEFGDFKFALTWRLITLFIAQTALILDAMYFMLADIKNDIREIKTSISALGK